MPNSQLTDADTIRVLIATDNHVGYGEQSSIRKDDSWKTFDEIINLARKEDVDMVLLAGDLFHENQPSRLSMFQVMRTLRKNCLGMKPCELQFLSDANEVFDSAFGHVNYEDADINISIPVFSIHGNHDDPSGEGHYCSLDLLQVAGLVNYFGRNPEADNISVKPVLLQKGQTKLALYGISNVRDERMFRNFRDHKVKWFRPNVQSSDWFNLLAVHQNHHAHTPTGYLPENVLPDWMDLVVWGHEHECLIDPQHNPETGFHVMQPGSSVATSLIPGEAVPKHVAVLTVSGKDFSVQKHRLKTVRPFMHQEVSLQSDKRFKGLEKKKDNRHDLTKKLMGIVEEMIEEAKAEWQSIQEDDEDDEVLEEGDTNGPRNGPEPPLPLIRLRVEYTAPEGGQYDLENPQRFSNRFAGKVANTNDVVQFYRKKTSSRKDKPDVELPEESMFVTEAEAIDVGQLVSDFLAAQSLKILPQQQFGDAVTQYVTKDDKRAMDEFVSESLSDQVKQMLKLGEQDNDLDAAMARFKERMEQQFLAGERKRARKMAKVKPKPDAWDSDLDGHWEDQPGVVEYDGAPATEEAPKPAARGRGKKAVVVEEDEDIEMDMDDVQNEEPAPKGRGKGRAAAAKPAAAKPTTRKAPARGRGKKAPVFEEVEEEDDAFVDEEDEPAAPPPKKAATTRSQPTRARPTRAAAASSSAKTRQTTLSFSQSQKASQKAVEISDDEISDDPFESVPTTKTRKR